jgi:hypothetical protein
MQGFPCDLSDEGSFSWSKLDVMTKAARSIFRDEAIKSYIQRQEKEVLPQLVAPPVFLFLWILLGLLLLTAGLAWVAQVPTYLEGSGIIVEQPPPSATGPSEAVALIFLPAPTASTVRTGLPVQVQLGSTEPALTKKIEQVEPGVLSPSAVRTRYALPSSVSSLLTQPVVVVSVRLGPSILAQRYAGSVVSAQVQVSSRRVLSLVPGFEQLIGE